ncbi:MAG: M50 family metallopeptidase [Pyrinomonadaceae bacterium]
MTLLICPFLAYGFGKVIYRTVSFSVLPKGLMAFAAGFVLFAFVWRIFKRRLQIVCTFEHELTHLLFGLLFLKRPHSFVVTRHDGGYVSLSGGNFVITLAPYFFPTISYLLLPFAFFIPANSLPVFSALLGASVAFHLASTWAELHPEQTDLHKAGILFSLIFLPAANLIFYGALLALIFGGAHSFLYFWSSGVKESFAAISFLFK